MKKLIWGLLGLTAGKRSMQGFYNGLLNVALNGMNFGRGGDFRSSGELALLKRIKQRYGGQQGLVLFDVGANVGHYSVAMADFFGTDAVVHAFEPSADTYAKLKATIGDRTGIRPHHTGLSNEVGTLSLYRNPERHTLASVYDRDLDHYGLKMDQVEEIALTTVDTFCEEQGIERIHFLKLDIEGHELSALKGAERMLREGRIDGIQFEFGGSNIDSRTYFHDFFTLLKDRYRIHRIVKDGLYPVDSYSEYTELFFTINYYAELRK